MTHFEALLAKPTCLVKFGINVEYFVFYC